MNPIQFNPFKGVTGTESIEQIKEKQNEAKPPEPEMQTSGLSMNQGVDMEGEIAPENFDFKLNKQIPPQK